MKFAHAIYARYSVSKLVHTLSKAKEKGVNRNMYTLLDGKADGLP